MLRAVLGTEAMRVTSPLLLNTQLVASTIGVGTVSLVELVAGSLASTEIVESIDELLLGIGRTEPVG